MDKFKVGDRVKIVKGLLAGEKTTVTSPKFKARLCVLETGEVWENCWLYRLDATPVGYPQFHKWALPEDWLSPIYDGYEKTTWEELAPYWKPKQLEKMI